MPEKINPTWKPDVPALWTVEQASIYLNVSQRTIHRLIARRELVARRVGDRKLIPRTSIAAFLKRDHDTESPEEKQARREKAQRATQ